MARLKVEWVSFECINSQIVKVFGCVKAFVQKRSHVLLDVGVYRCNIKDGRYVG